MTGAWSEPAFEEIARLVAQRTGLVFAPNRCQSLEQAVRHLMRQHAVCDLVELEHKLRSGSLLWAELIPQLTVGETYFFRDPQHFELFRARILPELGELRGAEYRPRVWSAGCATGEEAYSLAIALAESHKLRGAFVLGTDLSRSALSRARAARYKKWSLRGLDPLLFEKYFRWSGGEAVLSAELAAQVTFQELNLAGSGYPSPTTSTFAMDLILCRNVLIYLNAETIAHVARRFFDALSPGGFLITGPSDPLLSDSRFEIEVTPAGVVYWRPVTNFAAAARSSPAPSPAPPASEVRAVAAEAPLVTDEQLRAQAERAHEAGDERALAQLAVAHPGEAWLAVLAVRARSNVAPAQVVAAECQAALRRHPLSAELHYLHALTLLELSQQTVAVEALRRAIYLEPSLAIAHFTLGSVLASLKDGAGAERAYRNAAQRSGLRPGDEPVPCANEISAGGLAKAAARELELLRSRGDAR